MKRARIVILLATLGLAGCPPDGPEPTREADAALAGSQVDAAVVVATPDAPPTSVVPDAAVPDGAVVAPPPDAPPPPPPPDAAPPDAPATVCEPAAVVGRIWQFTSASTYFYLMLKPDGTYRRETDTTSRWFCEHGTWSVSACGRIVFQSCRGETDDRAWTATDTTFTLDQTRYDESSFSEEIAFSFCDVDSCTGG